MSILSAAKAFRRRAGPGSCWCCSPVVIVSLHFAWAAWRSPIWCWRCWRGFFPPVPQPTRQMPQARHSRWYPDRAEGLQPNLRRLGMASFQRLPPVAHGLSEGLCHADAGAGRRHDLVVESRTALFRRAQESQSSRHRCALCAAVFQSLDGSAFLSARTAGAAVEPKRKAQILAGEKFCPVWLRRFLFA
jgi:hypothetical protein